jgi:hypothetical protein
MQELPSEDLGGAASALRSDAQQISTSAANRVHDEVDSRKDQAVTQVRSVSQALERATGGLDEAAPAWIRSAFQQAASQIQRFAETLEQKDSRQMLGEIQSFARERPSVFLGACAAAGFAAARVFKAGGEQPSGGAYQESEEPSGTVRNAPEFIARAAGTGPTQSASPGAHIGSGSSA